jgi:hypothetical protein
MALSEIWRDIETHFQPHLPSIRRTCSVSRIRVCTNWAYRVQVLDMAQTAILSHLPIASGAAFDSHDDEHDPRCHPETRVALRRQIID